MALFKSPFDRVMEMYNKLSDEEKGKVREGIMDVEKAEDEREIDKIEETKADNAEEREEKAEEVKEESEEIGEKVDEVEKEEHHDEPDKYEDRFTGYDDRFSKIEDAIAAIANRLDALTAKRDEERKDFGRAEESREYNATEGMRETSKDLMKKYFKA